MQTDKDVANATTNIAPGTSVQINYKKDKCIVKLQRIVSGNKTTSHTTVDGNVFVRNVHVNNTTTNQPKMHKTTSDVVSDNVEVGDRNSGNVENIDANEITTDTEQNFSKLDRVLNELKQYFKNT